MNDDVRRELAVAFMELVLLAVRERPRQLSLTSLSTLDTLDRTGARRITELAAVEGVAQPSMTAVVAQVERAGLVQRRRDPDDARVVMVAISDAGREFLHQQRQLGAAAFASRLEALDDQDQAELAAVLPILRRLRQV
ncbi:MarR family transcriptional regulator [Acidiferrimicrobium sp. IK]|uniref:MarR family winged helix-turn-helix transcriptional regulator n=1 Tax=Acidiferrimicrobium sp. IK TaxID=2871700 RepID=UPI0021CB6F76|nr:MarR family transcriptional regulator [Acidiferrimicrobium sp. IK]MCU4186070.1 MarR family transcriptional regulator [Acidiferrimicrobium sp. IK]